MSGMEPLFAAKGLSVSLREKGRLLPVVFPVDLAVKAGGCTGMIGESGCGKSVLCRAVLGLLAVAGGGGGFSGGGADSPRE